jgi:hypothetical protein
MEKQKRGPYTIFAITGTVLRGAHREALENSGLAKETILERGDQVKIDEWEDACKLVGTGRFAFEDPTEAKKTAEAPKAAAK